MSDHQDIMSGGLQARENAEEAMRGLLEELRAEVHDLRTQNISLEMRISALLDSAEPKEEKDAELIHPSEKN